MWLIRRWLLTRLQYRGFWTAPHARANISRAIVLSSTQNLWSMTRFQPMIQSTLAVMEDTLLNRTFRDSDGNIVIAQMPNLPLLVWLAATLLKLLLTSGNLYMGLDALAFGSLFTWAWQEVFQGVNYFRRSLGFVVLLGALASKLQWAA